MSKKIILVILLSLIMVNAFRFKKNDDESSFANTDQVINKHFHINLEVDFNQRNMKGINTLQLHSRINGLTTVILDVNMLTIHKIVNEQNIQLKFIVKNPIQKYHELGQYLEIELDSPKKKGEIFNISIYYETSTKSESINWLNPEQTTGKIHPYLFSGCEALFCRQIAPFQDTPSVKQTFSALVRTPKPLKTFVSGNKTNEYQDEHYIYTEFRMDIPVPNYLFALVVGNLEEKVIGKRTSVITEPQNIEISAKELEDMDNMIQILENYIKYPYVWGYFKVVVLPPSFPIGGMENPLLTFASPSLIVGDKSNIGVIIHEMAHSWTGNLVTNKNWKNFWLNEGFTMYLQRVGVKIIMGEEQVPIDVTASYTQLKADLKKFGPDNSFGSLSPIYNGRSPDSAFSVVPYEKGYHFLKYLESVVGGENNFRDILAAWISENAYKSVTAEDFRNLLIKQIFKQQGIKGLYTFFTKVNWSKWLNDAGEPPVATITESTEIKEAKLLAQQYIQLKGESSPEDYQTRFRNLSVGAQQIMLDELLEHKNVINLKLVKKIEEDFSDILLNIRKCEIINRFLRLCIITKYQDKYQLLYTFMGSIGKMRTLTPVYQELKDNSMIDMAWDIFQQYQNFYHPVARKTFEELLKK